MIKKATIRLLLIYTLIFSGIAGNIYVLYNQSFAVVNIIEEETENQSKDTEKKDTKEYIKHDLIFKFHTIEINKVSFIYLSDWNSLIIEILSPPPELLF